MDLEEQYKRKQRKRLVPIYATIGVILLTLVIISFVLLWGTSHSNKSDEVVNAEVVHSDLIEQLNGIYVPKTSDFWVVSESIGDIGVPDNIYPSTLERGEISVNGFRVTYQKYGREMNDRVLPVLCMTLKFRGKVVSFSNSITPYYTEDVQDMFEQVLTQVFQANGIELTANDYINWGMVDEWDNGDVDSPYNVNKHNTGYTDDMYFEFSPEDGVITKFNYEVQPTPKAVVIPKWLKGTKVVGIAPEAFYRYHNIGVIDTVVIPDTVQYLGDNAFTGLDTLQKVYFSGDIYYMGKGCFKGCSSLQAIKLPKGVTTLRSETFKGCTSLTDVGDLTGVTVADNCFEGCTVLNIDY